MPQAYTCTTRPIRVEWLPNFKLDKLFSFILFHFISAVGYFIFSRSASSNILIFVSYIFLSTKLDPKLGSVLIWKSSQIERSFNDAEHSEAKNFAKGH